MENNPEKCLEKTIAALNKCRWLPFVRKDKVMELFVELSNSWRKDAGEALQREKSRSGKEKRILQAQFDDKLNETFRLSGEVFYEYRNAVLECSKVAFCHVECGAAKYMKCNGLCSKKDEYAKVLVEGMDDFMSDDFDTLLNDKQKEIWEKLMQGK